MASGLFVLLVLLGQQQLHIGVLAQERLGLVTPGVGQLRERLLDVARLGDGGFRDGSGFATERPVVNGLGLLQEVPGFREALLKLALRGGDAVEQREVAGGCLARPPAQLLDLADRNHQVLEPRRDSRWIQAWREENELAGRTLMRGGAWLV